MRLTGLTLLLVAGLLRPSSLFQPPSSSFDLLILNGHVIDGTGSPWYAADLGIRDGKVAAIGRLSGAQAKQTVDAKGKVVAPGFIDLLGQSELTVLVEPTLPSKIFQGITTELTGEGGSAAPLNDAIVKADEIVARLAHLRAVFRTRREAGAWHQHGSPGGRHAGAADGVG